MVKKTFVIAVTAALIGCQKELPETELIPTWEKVSEMSSRNFTTAAVLNNEIVLMSKDSIVTFDSDHKIVKTQTIYGEKSIETRSPYILENFDILSIPTYYFPRPGSTDSISIRFQKIDNDITSVVEHKQFPNYQTRGYKTRLFKSDIMSSYGEFFSIIMHSWNKSDNTAKDNTDDYFSILRITINHKSGLSSNVNKMIDIPELPFYESPKKYDLVRFKDYDFILASDGTHVISENGYKEKLESTQAIFKVSNRIMQLRGNSIYMSNDGSLWTKKTDIQSNVDWGTSKIAKVIDNVLIDYGWSQWVKYADLETGKTDYITENGLTDSEGAFFIEFNSFYYYGLENGMVYRIKKDNVIKSE